jgi:general secretion pathway protein K
VDIKHFQSLESSRHGQQGSALVVVLLIFALAFSLAVDVIYRQHHVQTRTANLLDWDYRYQYAVAAETLAIQGLIDDLQDDQKNNELVDDCKKESWSGPFAFPYEDAMIAASVQDLQGRFNLNSLAVDSNGTFVRDAEAIIRLERLLASILPPAYANRAAPLANEMADWIDSDTLVNGADGAEDTEYRLRRTPNQPVAHESDMRALRSFDAELAAAIEEAASKAAAKSAALLSQGSATGGSQANATGNTDAAFWQFFTALPFTARINVNTAPVKVLEAYFADVGAQAAAQTVVAQRQTEPYVSVSDVLSLPEFSKVDTTQQSNLAQLLSVGTEYFQVGIDVSTDSGMSRLVTRIKRPDSGETKVFARALQPVLSPLEPACNPD